MQLRLTRNLTRLALSVVLLGAGGLHAAEPSAGPESTLGGQEQARYLEQIKKLYLTSNERQALLNHANALLETYALRAGYQIGSAKPKDLIYQLAAGESGELLVREETRSEGRIEVRNRPLAIFGVDPFIRYECPAGGIVCEIKSPADGSTWLTVVRDHDGAAELAKALSFLIRNLQKG